VKKIYKICKWILFLAVLIFGLLILYIRFSRYTDSIIYKTNNTNYATLETTLNYEEFYFDRPNGIKIHGALFKNITAYYYKEGFKFLVLSAEVLGNLQG